jgi:hypothetical protein
LSHFNAFQSNSFILLIHLNLNTIKFAMNSAR